MKTIKKSKKVSSFSYTTLVRVVALALALPLVVYVLQKQQITQQHAQVTPRPAPTGCYYEYVPCDTTSCNPDLQRLVCLPTSAISLTSTSTQPSSTSFLKSLQDWFNSLFLR